MQSLQEAVCISRRRDDTHRKSAKNGKNTFSCISLPCPFWLYINVSEIQAYFNVLVWLAFYNSKAHPSATTTTSGQIHPDNVVCWNHHRTNCTFDCSGYKALLCCGGFKNMFKSFFEYRVYRVPARQTILHTASPIWRWRRALCVGNTKAVTWLARDAGCHLRQARFAARQLLLFWRRTGWRWLNGQVFLLIWTQTNTYGGFGRDKWNIILHPGSRHYKGVVLRELKKDKMLQYVANLLIPYLRKLGAVLRVYSFLLQLILVQPTDIIKLTFMSWS